MIKKMPLTLGHNDSFMVDRVTVELKKTKLFFQVRIFLFQLVFINSTRSFPSFLRRCS